MEVYIRFLKIQIQIKKNNLKESGYSLSVNKLRHFLKWLLFHYEVESSYLNIIRLSKTSKSIK